MFKIRLMQHTDLAAVVRLQDSCYHEELFESSVVVNQRLMLYPQSCWVACYQDKLWGYLFTYPALSRHVNPLGQEFGRYEQADCLYLHDMSVSPDARGLGVATALLNQAKHYASALGLQHLALVAVQNSASFWHQLGFREYGDLPVEAKIALASYGPLACYMTAELQNTVE